jgi:hypothetical protein
MKLFRECAPVPGGALPRTLRLNPMTPPARRRAAFLFALTLVACDVGGGVRSESFAVRDSAGIRIAESSGPAFVRGRAMMA